VGRSEGEVEVRRREDEMRKRREEEMREQPVMLRLEEELKELATGGRTKDLLHLLEEGAPFVVDMDGQTVLHVAASAGRLETVEALLDRGCDSNVQDFTGHTALQRAAAGGHLDIARLLVTQGASLDHQDELHGNTALHEAAWKGFSLTLSFLCQSRANVYMKNRGGFTALHLCCQTGHNQSCRVLLTHGCRPDIKNNYGDTPFHTAARYGHAGVIRILASAKCKVSEQNKNGDTSLHIAAAMGRRKLTRLLVECGTDPEVRNKQGETAGEIAVRKQLSEIVAILRGAVLEKPLQTIISDLEEKKEEMVRGGTRGVLERGPRRESARESARRKVKTRKANNNSLLDTSSSSLNSIRAGQKYQAGKRGRREEEERRRVAGRREEEEERRKMSAKEEERRRVKEEKPACECGPVLERIGATIEKDRVEILKHIDLNNGRMECRLESFEKKTKAAMFNFNQNMKESFAEERNDCQERMERRFLKDNIELERQQAIRDIMVKRDIARWLQARLAEIEARHGVEAESREAVRRLTRRRSRRETRAMVSELRHTGTLRRSHSAELVSELGDSEGEVEYRGLRINSQPRGGAGGEGGAGVGGAGGGGGGGAPTRTRVRHNSDGNYDDVSLMQETILRERGEEEDGKEEEEGREVGEDRVYQNLAFHRREENPEQRLAALISPSQLPRLQRPREAAASPGSSLASLNSVGLPKAQWDPVGPSGTQWDSVGPNRAQWDQDSVGLPTPRPSPRPSAHACALPQTSDCGSLDSHNDSGYSTRLGVSDGASPSLSGSIGTDPEPILDPQAIYMIPQEWRRGEDWSRGDAAPPPLPAKQPVFEPMMINTKSSLV